MEEKEVEEEKEPEEILEKRKRRISDWFKNPRNLALAIILIAALAIRLYFFFLTQNQVLWWDEAEYMLKGKSLFLGTPGTGWASQREIAIPILWGLFYAISGSELLPRILQVVVSILTIWLTYSFGKELYNKKVGLIASSIMAVNSIHLFFSVRLLTYLWAPLFFLLTFYFFWKGYIKRQGKKYLYLTPVVAAAGVSIYGSVAFGVIAIFLFLVITEKHKFLLKKEIWLMILIGVLVLTPHLIYGQLAYGSSTARFTALATTERGTPIYSNLLGYLKMFPHMFGNIFSIAIIIGIIYLLGLLILSFDLLMKKESNSLKPHLLIFLWALVVLVFYTGVGVFYTVVYDAFVLSAFPALAIIGANAFLLIYKIPMKKKILTFILIVLLILGAFFQLSYSNGIIKNKIESYKHVKDAGIWIKANSDPGDAVISRSKPQNTYYSERATYVPANSSEGMLEQFKEIKPAYFVDSIFESTRDHIHEFPQKHKEALTPVQAYYLDPQGQQVSLVIYKVDVSKL